MASRKKAMVQPPPAKPAKSQTAWSFKDENLARTLHQLGNNRPYIILEIKEDGWVVMFLGDSQSSIVKFKDGKPVIIKTR
ncbi:MAG: hypothetical protein WAV05_11885 [Anaerolineales bacterium]